MDTKDMKMIDKVFKLIKDLTDNDTLIIVGLLTLAFMSNDNQIITTVAGGFIGYMKGATK